MRFRTFGGRLLPCSSSTGRPGGHLVHCGNRQFSFPGTNFHYNKRDSIFTLSEYDGIETPPCGFASARDQIRCPCNLRDSRDVVSWEGDTALFSLTFGSSWVLFRVGGGPGNVSDVWRTPAGLQ